MTTSNWYVPFAAGVGVTIAGVKWVRSTSDSGPEVINTVEAEDTEYYIVESDPEQYDYRNI